MSSMTCRRFSALSFIPSASTLLHSRTLASASINGGHRANHECSPASQSYVKAMPPESYWFGSTTADDRQLLERLLEAVRKRDHNETVNQLMLLQKYKKSFLLQDAHMQLIIRAFRPDDYLEASGYTNTHRIYRRRMKFIRQWIFQSDLKVSRDVYFLLLEEGRLDKCHNGASQVASRTWSDMLSAGIEPDVYCYNSFMAATCVQPSIEEKVRLRRRNDSTTEKSNRTCRLQVAEEVLQRTIRIYRNMISKKIQPNAMTIELLLYALGRAANLDGLKSLLMQTWNILVLDPNPKALEDLGVVDEYDEEGIDMADKVDPLINTAKVPPDSTLYPSQETLIAIATAYGMNQQAQLGTQAVRLLARVYDIPVSTRVWTKLLKWLSLDSTRLQGFTAHSEVETTTEIADSTYGTRPSPSMYNTLLRHSLHSGECTDKIFPAVDDMIQDCLKIEQPDFSLVKYSQVYQQTRHVAVQALRRANKNYTSSIRKLERRLATAREHGGTDEIRWLENDVDRRTTALEQGLARAAESIRSADQKLKELSQSHPLDHEPSPQVAVDLSMYRETLQRAGS